MEQIPLKQFFWRIFWRKSISKRKFSINSIYRGPSSIQFSKPRNSNAKNGNSRQFSNLNVLLTTSQTPNVPINFKPKKTYYMLDVTKKFKTLINTGAGLSIFESNACKNYWNKINENITVQGIPEEIILMFWFLLLRDTHTKFTFLRFKHLFQWNFDSDFLAHYEGVVDIRNKQLITR